MNIIEIKLNDSHATHCIHICMVHYAHISIVMSYVDVDGTFPEAMYAILVYLFCGVHLVCARNNM